MTDFPPDSLPDDAGESAAGRALRVLYPLTDGDGEIPFEIACAVAESYDAELFVVDVDGPTSDPLATGSYADVAQKLLDVHLDRNLSVPVDGHTVTDDDPLSAFVSTVETLGIDAVVAPGRTDDSIARRIPGRVDCDVVTVDDKPHTASIGSVLAPVAGGPHSGGVVDVAGAVATATDAWVELLHVQDGNIQGEKLLAAAKQRLSGVDVDVDTRLIDDADVAATIAEQSSYYDLTVIGAPANGRLKRFLFGSTTTDIRDSAENTVAAVRHGDDPDQTLFSDALV